MCGAHYEFRHNCHGPHKSLLGDDSYPFLVSSFIVELGVLTKFSPSVLRCRCRVCSQADSVLSHTRPPLNISIITLVICPGNLLTVMHTMQSSRLTRALANGPSRPSKSFRRVPSLNSRPGSSLPAKRSSRPTSECARSRKQSVRCLLSLEASLFFYM